MVSDVSDLGVCTCCLCTAYPRQVVERGHFGTRESVILERGRRQNLHPAVILLSSGDHFCGGFSKVVCLTAPAAVRTTLNATTRAGRAGRADAPHLLLRGNSTILRPRSEHVNSFQTIMRPLCLQMAGSKSIVLANGNCELLSCLRWDDTQ